MDSCKVLLIGNSASGKTAACRRLMGLTPDGTIITTVGAEVHNIRVASGNTYMLWDTAGKENFGGLRDAYYLGSNIVLIFHGGEEYLTPEQWESDVKRVAPDAKVYHIKGNFEEKHASVSEILS